jgi:hypothetical protein
MNQKPYGNSQFIRTSKNRQKIDKNLSETAKTNCELHKQTGISPCIFIPPQLHNNPAPATLELTVLIAIDKKYLRVCSRLNLSISQTMTAFCKW